MRATQRHDVYAFVDSILEGESFDRPELMLQLLLERVSTEFWRRLAELREPIPEETMAEFRRALDVERPMLGAMLDQAAEAEVRGRTLHVVFPWGMNALERQFVCERNRTTVERIASEAIGRPVRVKVAVRAVGA